MISRYKEAVVKYKQKRVSDGTKKTMSRIEYIAKVGPGKILIEKTSVIK